MSLLRTLTLAVVVLFGHADAAGCGIANSDGSAYAVTLRNTAPQKVTLTLDRLLANQLLTSRYLSTATSTATDTMIVLARDANMTLLFEKDTIAAAHRPKSAFIHLAWAGNGSSEANIRLSDPITHRQKFGDHLEVSGFITSHGDVCTDGWLTKVSTASDRSDGSDDDYAPHLDIQLGTDTCISRVGAACGTAACCGGLVCQVGRCKLDGSVFVPIRVDHAGVGGRANITDLQKSASTPAVEADSTGIVVGIIMSGMAMLGFALLVIKMRRDAKADVAIDIAFDARSYDPRSSRRGNKFGRWATFDTVDNDDGLSYNYDSDSEAGSSRFGGAHGRSITNASNNYTRNHTHASIPSLAMPHGTIVSDVSTMIMEDGIYVPDLKSQSHRYVKLGKGKGGQTDCNTKIAGPILTDETDTTTTSSQYA
jgi:hypothetical protein